MIKIILCTLLILSANIAVAQTADYHLLISMDGDLVEVDPDSGATHTIYADDCVNVPRRLLNDGHSLIFRATGTGCRTTGLYRLDLTTGAVSYLIAVDGQISPDGRLLAELRAPSGSGSSRGGSSGGYFDVYVWDIARGTERHIGEGNSIYRGNIDLVWSPDSRLLAYELDGIDYTVYVVDVESNELTILSDEETAASMPAWTPDGSQFMIHQRRRDGQPSQQSGMYAFESPFMLESARFVVEFAGSGEQLSWSPDGSHIAFTAWTSFNKSLLITMRAAWIADLTTGKATQLHPTSESGVDPVWSPDGSRLAYWQVDYDVAPVYPDRPFTPGTGTNRPINTHMVLHLVEGDENRIVLEHRCGEGIGSYCNLGAPVWIPVTS